MEPDRTSNRDVLKHQTEVGLIVHIPNAEHVQRSSSTFLILSTCIDHQAHPQYQWLKCDGTFRNAVPSPQDFWKLRSASSGILEVAFRTLSNSANSIDIKPISTSSFIKINYLCWLLTLLWTSCLEVIRCTACPLCCGLAVWKSNAALHAHFAKRATDMHCDARERAKFAGFQKKFENPVFIKNLAIIIDATQELSELSLAI